MSTAQSTAEAESKSHHSSLRVVPLDGGFGAEVRGLDLSKTLSRADFAVWRDAIEVHGVVVLRDQEFSPAQHIAFSEMFGPLETSVDPKFYLAGYPKIIRVSNVDAETNEIKPVDDLSHKSFTLGTSDWHSDSSFRHIPSKASLLCAREVPADGGDTGFSNTWRAYEALPHDKKDLVDGLTAVHDFQKVRRIFGLPPRAPDVQAASPPVRQPLVQTLPDGRRALLIGMHCDHVETMTREGSDALLVWLRDWCIQPRFVYVHKWRVGDLVMWDNRTTMHRAMPYDLANARRVLHRTTVEGDGPLI